MADIASEPALRPQLSVAHAPWLVETAAYDESGRTVQVRVPAERALTLYLDKRELVTLMTLGLQPELLTLGYLRNQRLLQSLNQIEAVTVDWEVGASAISTRPGVVVDALAHLGRRVVTTGCGQGSLFSHVIDELDHVTLPATTVTPALVQAVVQRVRDQPTIYKQSGSVHGCALLRQDELLLLVEDVGRHNALDTLAGWLWWQQGDAFEPRDLLLYTTGRLTSEMMLKAALMGVAVVISRSGITQMGLELAQRLGQCAIGRALHQRFLCYAGKQRMRWP